METATLSQLANVHQSPHNAFLKKGANFHLILLYQFLFIYCMLFLCCVFSISLTQANYFACLIWNQMLFFVIVKEFSPTDEGGDRLGGVVGIKWRQIFN